MSPAYGAGLETETSPTAFPLMSGQTVAFMHTYTGHDVVETHQSSDSIATFLCSTSLHRAETCPPLI